MWGHLTPPPLVPKFPFKTLNGLLWGDVRWEANPPYCAHPPCGSPRAAFRPLPRGPGGEIPPQDPVPWGRAAGMGRWGPVGANPYVQVEGFIKERVQLVPLALGGPSHHLGELVPGLQGELDEGVAGAWWGVDISPLLLG